MCILPETLKILFHVGWTSEGDFMVAGECKCLIDDCEEIKLFPPGHSISFNEKNLPTGYIYKSSY